MMKPRFWGSLLLLITLVGVWGLAPLHTAHSQNVQGTAIRVGSKRFTENRILGQIILIALEDAGFTVQDVTDLGDTDANREALIGGAIDVYVEYTGTALSNFFKAVDWVEITDTALRDPYLSYVTTSTLDAVLFDMIWLQPAPANNVFAIAVTRQFSEENNITTLEDFAQYVNDGGELYLAASNDFTFRPDALPLFESVYGFEIPGDSMFILADARPDVTETALYQGVNGINASMAFGTDPLLQAYDLVALEDTLGAQPVFQPAPVFRGEVIRANPTIISILNPIFLTLDAETLRNLNARVDVDELTPRDAAEAYLQENGFLE